MENGAPKSGKVKPNGFPKPTPIGNTTGLILNKTSPEPKSEPGKPTPPVTDLSAAEVASAIAQIMMDPSVAGVVGTLATLPISVGGSPADDLPTPTPGNGVNGGYVLGASAVEKRKQRYEERKQLLAETAGDPPDIPPAVHAANERFEFNNDNILRAEAAQYVYDVDVYRRGMKSELPEPPLGLELVKPESIGLEMKDFMDKETGFGAAVFHSEISGENMLVYRGTNNGFTGKKDWATNGMQGLGFETDQYNQAMDLAASVDEIYDGNVTMVGHSLGGGLASSGVAVTGNSGYTFNSAGLHPNTAKRRRGLNNDQVSKLITSQSVAGEVLTGAQSTTTKSVITGAATYWGGPLGGVVVGGGFAALDWLPQASGTMLPLEGSGLNPVARHGMDQVKNGIELQKKEDEAILKQYLAGS